MGRKREKRRVLVFFFKEEGARLGGTGGREECCGKKAGIKRIRYKVMQGVTLIKRRV